MVSVVWRDCQQLVEDYSEEQVRPDGIPELKLDLLHVKSSHLLFKA